MFLGNSEWIRCMKRVRLHIRQDRYPSEHGCCLQPQEGAGHAVLSAYVEIVFDNSDNRIPVSLTTSPAARRRC